MVIAAEGTGADAALTTGFSVSSSSPGISVERPGYCAGMIVDSARADVAVGRPIACVGAVTRSTAVAVKSAVHASTSVEVVPVIERVALRVVPVVVMN
jgi:hypothetical protein